MLRYAFAILFGTMLLMADVQPAAAVMSAPPGEQETPAGVDSAAYGHLRRDRLGIALRDVTADVAEAIGLQETVGVVVTNVDADSTAAAAGIRVGDVIVAVNRRPISGTESLRSNASLMTIGAAVELTVWRDGRRQTVRAWLARPERTQRAPLELGS
jgi:S1-C subfamily serine protease